MLGSPSEGPIKVTLVPFSSYFLLKMLPSLSAPPPAQPLLLSLNGSYAAEQVGLHRHSLRGCGVGVSSRGHMLEPWSSAK